MDNWSRQPVTRNWWIVISIIGLLFIATTLLIVANNPDYSLALGVTITLFLLAIICVFAKLIVYVLTEICSLVYSIVKEDFLYWDKKRKEMEANLTESEILAEEIQTASIYKVVLVIITSVVIVLFAFLLPISIIPSFFLLRWTLRNWRRENVRIAVAKERRRQILRPKVGLGR